jgi:hypothetical protein
MKDHVVALLRRLFWDRLAPTTQHTWMLRGFGLARIPMLLFCQPSIAEFTPEVCVVRIPLNWLTRNHLRSMYFGALAVGADCAGGYAATMLIRERQAQVSFIFGEFTAKFHKRPEADTLFRCADGLKMAALVDRAIASGERVHDHVDVVATSPAASGESPVATFRLTVSLKARGAAKTG